MLPAQPNQSLIDGLACLQALASNGSPVGSRELGRQLNLEPTRVNRLLKTLAHLGIAQQTPEKQYIPGPGMHVLAAQAMFGSGLMRRAVGPLETLRPFGLYVAMGVLWRDHVSYLYHAPPGSLPGEAIGRAGLSPATRSSIGMVLLSRLKVPAVRELYRGAEIPNFASLDALLRELDQVRRRGYAFLSPFKEQPTKTIAVAIENESAGIAMSGDIASADRGVLVKALRAAADAIAAKANRAG